MSADEKPQREPRTVSVTTAAVVLEMSTRAVRLDIERGLIPAVRHSERGHWRIPIEFVRTYQRELEKQSEKSAERARKYLSRKSA